MTKVEYQNLIITYRYVSYNLAKWSSKRNKYYKSGDANYHVISGISENLIRFNDINFKDICTHKYLEELKKNGIEQKYLNANLFRIENDQITIFRNLDQVILSYLIQKLMNSLNSYIDELYKMINNISHKNFIEEKEGEIIILSENKPFVDKRLANIEGLSIVNNFLLVSKFRYSTEGMCRLKINSLKEAIEHSSKYNFDKLPALSQSISKLIN